MALLLWWHLPAIPLRATSAMSWVKHASPCAPGMGSRQPVPATAFCILQKHSLALRRVWFLIPPCAKLLIELLQPAPCSVWSLQDYVEAFLFHFSPYWNQICLRQGCRSCCKARTKQWRLWHLILFNPQELSIPQPPCAPLWASAWVSPWQKVAHWCWQSNLSVKEPPPFFSDAKMGIKAKLDECGHGHKAKWHLALTPFLTFSAFFIEVVSVLSTDMQNGSTVTSVISICSKIYLWYSNAQLYSLLHF